MNLVELAQQLGMEAAAEFFVKQAQDRLATLGIAHPWTADAHHEAAIGNLCQGNVPDGLRYLLMELVCRSYSRQVEDAEPLLVFGRLHILYHREWTAEMPFVDWLTEQLNRRYDQEGIDTSGASLCAAYWYYHAEDMANALTMVETAAKISSQLYGPESEATMIIMELLSAVRQIVTPP